MSKIKMRCNTCGKWFQSANAKEVTCPDCQQKARKEKLMAKSAPQTGRPLGQGAPGQPGGAASRPVPPPPPKPASSGSSHWLDSQNDVKVAQPDQPRPKLPSSPTPRDNRGEPDRGGSRGAGSYRDERGQGNYRDERRPGSYRDERGPGGYRDNRGPGGYRDERGQSSYGGYRTPAPYRVGGGMGIPDTVEPRPRQPMTGGPNRGPRPAEQGEGRPDRPRHGGKSGPPKAKTPKPQAPPKPKREKIPPPAPFAPTAEQIAQVEARYAELAVPTEFDGIRTQISKELDIPKTAVKKIVKEYREKLHIPSWWETQTYKGDSEEYEKIKAAYEPHLPLPAIGVHKQIAEQLSLKPSLVYQAIKTIRLEMKLPQFNDPALHGIELRKPHEQATEAAAQEQHEEVVEAATQEQHEQTAEAAAQEQHEEVVEAATQEGKEPQGEISSIETDTTFHKVDDTIEVAAAATPDANTGEAE
ncbi:MAG: hypothetical protein ACJ8BW_25065 [Ktedonobacteraceae bacterium]